MTFDDFQSQVDRLVKAYGAAAFSQERAHLIWRDVRPFSLVWLERVVDSLLATERQAPLPVKFAEAASIERERIHKINKEKQRDEAQDFMSSFSGADIQTICGAIKARAVGSMRGEDYKAFISGLRDVSRKVVFGCSACEDTGKIYTGAKSNRALYVFRCPCSKGTAEAGRYPVWNNALQDPYTPDNPGAGQAHV